ncbi:hypothetical protein Hanom_Chr00s000648g01653391 [Helianthus anomalus]
MERASWEKYRERLLTEAREFEQKEQFFRREGLFREREKVEEWGRDGLTNKLHAAEELLAKERAEFKKACDNENKRMYAVRTKITNLEAEVATLKRKVEEAQADRERVEVELSAQLVNKNKDLVAKDVEIAELKRRLFEAHVKSVSLEINLAAEKVKADIAEEARTISTSALNVAQNNYDEAQSIVGTLMSESEWMHNHGVAAISVANSLLNTTELDQTVAALTDAARAVGHRGGYLECAQHVKEALGQPFGTRNCSVTDQANKVLS